MKTCTCDNGEECSALREKKCNGCAFRKTKEELVKGREKAIDRISSLPQSKQIYIRRKYYS
jgi:hypothetical protein